MPRCPGRACPAAAAPNSPPDKPRSWEPREIVDQRPLNQLAGKCTGLRIDKFALILLGKEHWPQLTALVIEELGGDARALPPDNLDALSTLTVLPILVKIAAPAVRRAHLDQPALADREHRVDRGLHRIADVGRLVFDDQLGRRKAPHRVGITRQRDDARAVGQGAARFIIFLELLDRLELFEKANDLGKQFARLAKARRDEQHQTGIVNRLMQPDDCGRGGFPTLPAAIQQDPARRRSYQLRLPRIRTKSEPILGEQRRVERVHQPKANIKRHRGRLRSVWVAESWVALGEIRRSSPATPRDDGAARSGRDAGNCRNQRSCKSSVELSDARRAAASRGSAPRSCLTARPSRCRGGSSFHRGRPRAPRATAPNGHCTPRWSGRARWRRSRPATCAARPRSRTAPF